MNSALYRVMAATAAVGSLAAHEPASASSSQPETSSPRANAIAPQQMNAAIAPIPMAIAPDSPTVDFSNSKSVVTASAVTVSPTSNVATSQAQLAPLPTVPSAPVVSPPSTQALAAQLPTVGVSPAPQTLPRVSSPTSPVSSPVPTQTAAQMGQYRVVVPANTAAMQQRVRTAVPDSFRTTVNGQTVMQVGLFQDQSPAEELKRSLERQNLQASIVSVGGTVAPSQPSQPAQPVFPSQPQPSQSAAGSLYRIIVPVSTAAMQQRVRAIAPDAFRTTLNGQTVMQAGLFQDQGTAEALKRSFDQQNLRASIIVTPGTAVPPSQPSPPRAMVYRVIVPASTTAVQQRVRAIAPDAFRTTLNGQTVMQAGLFRDQATAATLQQSFNRQNLQASIVPIAETSVRPPQVPSPSNPSAEVPKDRIVVMIDPGHGGADPGAIGIGGLREEDIVLSISQQVASLLEQEGIQAILTRGDDRGLELSTRVQLAQRANANYFVSIHANSLNMSRPDVNGVETFYHNSGRELAQSIQNSIMQNVDMNNRGVKQANFYVLRNTSMPAALVEVGFVTGRDDAAKLRDAGFRTTMAGAIARGIVQNVRSR
ncbi:N-acetylmuramoyl-L-alanine amidase [Leptolyngbya sp. FACHB-541]|uniref:N-acetylmuramoyl-L-alanine amidase n=1 Tax=Leptolyngbya sp. FACHB-541 TaxID=2692810 RepID=UPI00168871B3|nr:N-acetylmuramoyl-L-alanine amidase [Leptolyngbya sp. FACHB-541]MBD1997530.1 N-acetylmuramoyl-L-alanine amidase [Leptolyngbya sp. FACHB-541]